MGCRPPCKRPRSGARGTAGCRPHHHATTCCSQARGSPAHDGGCEAGGQHVAEHGADLCGGSSPWPEREAGLTGEAGRRAVRPKAAAHLFVLAGLDVQRHDRVEGGGCSGKSQRSREARFNHKLTPAPGWQAPFCIRTPTSQGSLCQPIRLHLGHKLHLWGAPRCRAPACRGTRPAPRRRDPPAGAGDK